MGLLATAMPRTRERGMPRPASAPSAAPVFSVAVLMCPRSHSCLRALLFPMQLYTGLLFLTFRSHSSLSVARNAADFCVLTAYPAAFLNLLAPTAFGWSLWGFLCRASRRLQTATCTSCLSTPALDVAFTAHKHLSLGPLSGQHLLPLHK